MSSIERARTPEPRIPVSSQLGVRVAVIGGFALIMFGIIFFRLWYLQVLSGEQYVQQATANTTREVPIPAPRGQILGRDGELLVTSRVTNAVQIVPSELPPAGPKRRALYRRLGKLLGMTPARIREVEKKGLGELPYAPVTIKTDAGRGVLTVLAERQNEYPGVTQEPVSIRDYRYGELAAQIFGYVGQVGEAQLKRPGFKGVKQGTIVGQAGLEYYYDRYLRGTPGEQPVQVNSENHVVPTKRPIVPPQAGYSLRLTLDLGLQREGEVALRRGVELAHGLGHPGSGAAFVAMDPRNGQIYAMGSYPSFDPNRLTKPVTKHELEEIEQRGVSSGPDQPAPFTDRAVEGGYPTGSTFKPITAMASLEAGLLSPTEGLGAGQCITAGLEQFCNAGQADYGAVGLVDALKVSSDTYFFEVGERDNSHGPVIQKMASRLGIGKPTGIDLPSEAQGVVPDARWRVKENHRQENCERHHPKSHCGFVAEIRPWSVGDNMHLAVGQGDLLTDPLQMAVAYSALANAYTNEGRGTVVTPHLGMAIESPGGGIVQAPSFAPKGHVHFNYSNLALVMEGIHDATSQPGGTSTDVWQGWNQALHPVYGKTGTAERAGQVEQAWYMCYLPDPKRPIVLAVTVEQGGFGDEAAAPVARLLAEKWFGERLKLVNGSSADK
ncbi:MAG TPA: penicillin-binding transpeptidase domain-containing protein [Solirubrobacteraceae bacterium]|jgi:penicillin-binding protein 2